MIRLGIYVGLAATVTGGPLAASEEVPKPVSSFDAGIYCDTVDRAVAKSKPADVVAVLEEDAPRSDGYAMDQNSRLKELDRFKSGEVNILVASDVAARGLDIKGVSHVFNFDTPWHPDDYVHRIGRTGRAGAKGRAFTFVADEDAEAIANVEKLTGSAIKVFGKEDVRVELAEAEAKPEKSRDKKPRAEKPRDEEAREEKPKKPRREKRARDESSEEKPSKGRSRRKDQQDDEPVPAGEWNGPRPGFLDFSAG